MVAFVNALGRGVGAVGQHEGPGGVAVAFHHRVGGAHFERLVGIKGGVNAAVNDPGAALARGPAYCHSAQSIAGVDTDAHDVARLDEIQVESLEGFIHENRIAVSGWSRRSQYVEPAWRDHADPERNITWIDQKNAQGSHSPLNFQRER